MNVDEINVRRYIDNKRCFNDTVCDNPMMIFHGTSNIFEESIEKLGLNASTDKVINLSEIQTIIDLFKRLKWYGESPAGFSVLSAYSQKDYETITVEQAPIFFAESSYRASLYATKDFAGGESVRAAFYALEDLKKFISNKSLRDNHFEDLKKDRNKWGKTAHPSFLKQFEPEIGLDELNESFKLLQELKDRIADLRAQYEYGIIYAVDASIDSQLIKSLELLRGNGIRTFSKVSKASLAAKCIFNKPLKIADYEEDPDRLSFISKPNGLFQIIRPKM
ncbi:hypothetical protein [Glaciecola sp. SC05]|uniref:hypothetical protein n=1 Tax=Glaciecola sp. SC05 TaxID=1987355 RepID=UPI003527E49A